MTRVIKGWLLPNVGFKFRVDRPDGWGDMGIGARRLEGGCNRERWLRFTYYFLVRCAWDGEKLAYVEMY